MKTRPSKLKIAVLLAGNLRTFEETAPFLKKYLLDLYDSDVFIHTFNTLEHKTPAHHGQTGEHIVTPMVDDKIKAKVIELYKPKKFVIATNEEKISIKGDWRLYSNPYRLNSAPSVPLNGLYRMLYDRQQVNILRQEYEKSYHVNYDFVVFIRPDIMLLEPMELESYQEFFDFNKKTIIWFPAFINFYSTSKAKFLTSNFGDTVFFGKPAAMDILLNMFDEFDRYFIKATKLPFPNAFLSAPESFEALYAHEKNIFLMNGKINYVLKRKDSAYNIICVHEDRPDIDGDSYQYIKKRRATILAKRMIFKIMPPALIDMIVLMKVKIRRLRLIKKTRHEK